MPRKLGQHFLTRDSVLERLATAACGDEAERVIEIGPGRGALTRHLLPHTQELHAIERDLSLVAYLQRKFAQEPKLHIHSGDVLSTALTQWGAAILVGNLPYYITSPIIEKFLSLDARFASAVFLMQREVAERITAQSGTRHFGYLSVAVQIACDVELFLHVPADAFSPPPKVDSAAVRFRRKADPPGDLPNLLKFAGRCFVQKRKTLRNNLRPFFPLEQINALPEADLRAEQLTVAQFVDLFSRLYTETS